MPIFASVTAHAVIDTLTVLMWHKIFFSRLCHDMAHLQHLKALVEYYLRQCQPGPLPFLHKHFLFKPQITLHDSPFNDDLS